MKLVPIDPDLEWLKAHLPRAVRLQPGAWNECRQYSDGRAYDKSTARGTLYVIVGGRVDTQGRRWLSLLISLQKDRDHSVAPDWDMVRSVCATFFDRRIWIIPTVPDAFSIGVLPATIVLWSCLDGETIPAWPEEARRPDADPPTESAVKQPA